MTNSEAMPVLQRLLKILDPEKRLIAASDWEKRRRTSTPSPQLARLVTQIGALRPELVPALSYLYAGWYRKPSPPPFGFYDFSQPNVAADLLRPWKRDPNRPRSIAFYRNSYYHFFYLAKALRARGWNAIAVTVDPPNGPYSAFQHGADLSLYDQDPNVYSLNIIKFFGELKLYFDMVHFSGAGYLSIFPENNDYSPKFSGIPWDVLELRRHGLKVGYTTGLCNDGVRQSTVYSFANKICDHCIWQNQPNVCSDERNANFGRTLSQVCDLIATECDWALENRTSAKAFREPLTAALDPLVWDPSIAVPEKYRIDREPGELIIFHGFARASHRTGKNRDIKGSNVVRSVVERLKSEGAKVRLHYVTDVPSIDVRYAQVQSDIVIDQLLYGRFGATAREAMMLGKPTIGYIDRRQPRGLPAQRALADVPLIEANPETLYAVLKDLLQNPGYLHDMGERSRKFAMKWFSADKCAERFEKVYDRIRLGLPPDDTSVFM